MTKESKSVTSASRGKAVRRRIATAILATCAAMAAVAGMASAALAAPVLEVKSHHGPTVFQPGSEGTYTFLISNVGDTDLAGPLTVQVALPAGVTTRLDGTMLSVELQATLEASEYDGWDCSSGENIFTAGKSSVTCVKQASGLFPDTALAAGQVTRLHVFVAVDPAATGLLEAQATVTAGVGTITDTETAPSGAPASQFGLVPGTFEADAYDRAGVPERQAGAHPFRVAVGFDVNLDDRPGTHYSGATRPDVKSVGNVWGLEVTAPRGLVGNPTAVRRARTTIC